LKEKIDPCSREQIKKKSSSANNSFFSSIAEQRCILVKNEMKCKVGKEPEGGSKKRKEVGNESPLDSMFVDRNGQEVWIECVY
jgi:hypothetical protein